MQNLFEKLSQNFVVTAFIPSLAFVLIALFLFWPIIFPPDFIKEWLFDGDSLSLVNGTTLILIPTFLIGFTLLNLNTFIYKLTEGYFVLNRFRILRRRQQKKALRLKYQIKQLEHLHNKTKSIHLLGILYQRKVFYQLRYPFNVRAVLPTRFGNIFRAAEEYPRTKYRIDAVTLWPRLIHVMPESYYNKLEQSNSGLAFLINCMVLSLLTILLCIFAFGYLSVTQTQLIVSGEKVIESSQTLHFLSTRLSQSNWRYLIASFFASSAFLFFYNAALPAARQYGNLVRSSFDLFRLKLLETLELTSQLESSDELDIWFGVSESMAHAGLTDLNFLVTHRQHKANNNDSPSQTGKADDDSSST